MRFKDRNPSPIGGLATLMRESYLKILRLGDAVDEKTKSLRLLSASLTGVARFTVQLIALKFGLGDAERLLLVAHLAPDIAEEVPTDQGSQGWEETVSASLSYLLKTSLGKQNDGSGRSNKEANAVMTSSSLDMPENIDRLRSYINLVVDKLSKGERLS